MSFARSSEFDWEADADSVVVPEQPAIAVYKNHEGHVVIRQAGHYGPDEDQSIVIVKENVAKLVERLLEVARVEAAPTAPPSEINRATDGPPLRLVG